MRDVPGLIDTRNPVEWGSPLNRGLVAWWLGLPSWSGGQTLFDLRRRFDGTMTNGPAWAGAARGFRALQFDGSNDYVAGSSVLSAATNNFFVEMVIQPGSLPQAGFVFSNGEGGGSNAGWGFGVLGTSFGNSGDRLTWLQPGIAWRNFSYQFPTAGSWYHVVVGIDSGTWRAWVNGVQDATTFADGINSPSAAWRIGARSDGSLPFNGSVQSVRFSEVAPSQSLASGLYDQYLRGYPDTLRRYVPRAYLFIGGGGSANEQNLSGSSTAAGSLAKAVSKAAAGSGTASGACGRLAAKPLAGSSTGAATLARLAAKALAGSSTGTGVETRSASKALAGSSTGTGSVAKQTAKAAAGSGAATGSLARAAAVALAGSETGTGAVAKAVAKPLSGSETASGATTNTNVRTQSVSGSSTPTGAETRQANKAAAGSTTGTGACVRAASKPLAGSATGSGAVAKLANKAAAGGSTPTGTLSTVRAALQALAGSVTAIGSLVRAAVKYLAGRVTGSGSLATSGGSEPVVVETTGGTYRRRGDLSRRFRRLGSLSRVFRGYTRVADQIQYDTRVKDASETVSFLFDFSRFDELKDANQGGGGETLGTPVVDSVAGLTIGTPAVITEDRDGVPAGKGIAVAISGGTASATYSLECRGTTSGGAIRVVKGKLVVE